MLKTENHYNKNYSYQDVVSILNEKGIYFKSTCDEVSFNSFCSINEIKSHSITWVKNLDEKKKDIISKYHDVLVFADIKDFDDSVKNVIFLNDLKRSFFYVIEILFSYMNLDIKETKIESTAVVLTEHYGDELYVGHNCFIDENVKIGNNVTIMNNVVIQGTVNIGNDVFIESGSVIGACGFGYYKDDANNPHKVPHLGGIVIGNHVTIGAGNCISRGSLNNTIIGDYVKTDNLCHIAHSDVLHEGVMLAACAELSGSVEVGKDTWIAPGVTVINGAKIGKNVYTDIN